MEARRVPTYVDGLDDLLHGGLPWGQIVLISGDTGTMKSTLAYAIAHGNARERHANVLYVTLEQSRKSLEAQMVAMGFPADAVRGSVHVLDSMAIQKGMGKVSARPMMEFLRRTLTTKKDVEGIDLVVLDSLEALEVLAKFEDRRQEVFQLFEWLRDFGATTLIVTAGPSESRLVGLEPAVDPRDETFLADGIIELRMDAVSDARAQRRIRIVKMRGTRHEAGLHPFAFEDGHLRVLPVASLEGGT